MINGHWWPVIDIAQRKKKKTWRLYVQKIIQKQMNWKVQHTDSCHLFRTNFLCTFISQHQINPGVSWWLSKRTLPLKVSLYIQFNQRGDLWTWLMSLSAALTAMLVKWVSCPMPHPVISHGFWLAVSVSNIHQSPSNENQPILITNALVCVVVQSQRSTWVKRIFKMI